MHTLKPKTHMKKTKKSLKKKQNYLINYINIIIKMFMMLPNKRIRKESKIMLMIRISIKLSHIHINKHQRWINIIIM